MFDLLIKYKKDVSVFKKKKWNGEYKMKTKKNKKKNVFNVNDFFCLSIVVGDWLPCVTSFY